MEDVRGDDARREEILEAWMERYQASVLRMCFAYLRDRQLAEDAAQETFVKAYRALSAFRGDSDEKTWLMRIAINVCKDMRRGAWFRYVDRGAAVEGLPAPRIDMTEEQRDLARDVMRLPRKYLEVILLYYYQNMTTRETARALKLTQSTVASRLKRAREKLRVSLEGGDQDE